MPIYGIFYSRDIFASSSENVQNAIELNSHRPPFVADLALANAGPFKVRFKRLDLRFLEIGVLPVQELFQHVPVVCFCKTVTISEVRLVPRYHNLWATLYILREILNFQESQVKSFETHFTRCGLARMRGLQCIPRSRTKFRKIKTCGKFPYTFPCQPPYLEQGEIYYQSTDDWCLLVGHHETCV
eukprot:sb/3471394/